MTEGVSIAGAFVFVNQKPFTIKEAELAYVAHILRSVEYDIPKAAQILGVSTRAVYRRLKQIQKRDEELHK